MNIDRSHSHSGVAPAGARSRKSASFRRGLAAATFVVAAFATAGLCGTASASPDVETGPAITVTASQQPVEAAYASTVQHRLERAKRYPTGREASLSHPSGTTDVWVDVARDGHPVGRGVLHSSGSALLDWTATNLVGRMTYPAFPADAWSGGATHRFLVSYRFVGDVEETGTAQAEVAVHR